MKALRSNSIITCQSFLIQRMTKSKSLYCHCWKARVNRFSRNQDKIRMTFSKAMPCPQMLNTVMTTTELASCLASRSNSGYSCVLSWKLYGDDLPKGNWHSFSFQGSDWTSEKKHFLNESSTALCSTGKAQLTWSGADESTTFSGRMD